MINELKRHLNEKNEHLIKELVYIIRENNLENIDDLIKFENEHFKVNNKYLNKKERIKYATDIALFSYWDYDGLELEEISKIHALKQSLKTDISDNEKIFNLIKLFDFIGNECLFVAEAYNLIVNDKY